MVYQISPIRVCFCSGQVLRPLLYKLDIDLLYVLVEKLRLEPPEEVIEDTVNFIKDTAEATQQVLKMYQDTLCAHVLTYDNVFVL